MVGKRITALLLAMGMVVTAAAGCSKSEDGNQTVVVRRQIPLHHLMTQEVQMMPSQTMKKTAR